MTDLRTRPETVADRPARRSTRPRTLSAAQVLVVGIVVYTGAILLNASWLQRWANSLPIGTQRTVMLRGANLARGISHAIWLDRPGNAIERLRHQPVMPVHVPLVPPAPAVHATSVAPAPAPAPVPVLSVVVTSVVAATSVVRPADRFELAPPAAATLIVPAANHVPTVVGLSLWFGGDSLAQGIGEAMRHVATETDNTTVNGRGIVSSGLSRPDVLDWATEVASAKGASDVVVMMVGANDTADIVTSTGVAAFGEQAWLDEYTARVANVMSQVDRGTTTMVWLGLPPVRNASLEQKLRQIDELIRAEAARHPHVIYVDLHAAFGTEDGSYRGYCDGFGGGQVLCRSNDGVHFNDAGYEMVARLVMHAAAR
jgi:lysophospholipase L1-like esterase